MALIIDGSTPAVALSSATTNTCASFTPPDSPLLLVLWAGNTTVNVDPAAPSISSSPAQSWVLNEWDHRASGAPTEDGQTAIWNVPITGSPGAMTVTVTSGVPAHPHSAMAVLVLTGHDPVAPTGVSGSARHDLSVPLISFTASITGGQSFYVLCDYVAGSTTGWGGATGCTLLGAGTIAGQISYGLAKRTDPDEVAGVTTSIGVTGPGSGVYHHSYVEVISLAARLASLGISSGPPACAKHQAANW